MAAGFDATCAILPRCHFVHCAPTPVTCQTRLGAAIGTISPSGSLGDGLLFGPSGNLEIDCGNADPAVDPEMGRGRRAKTYCAAFLADL